MHTLLQNLLFLARGNQEDSRSFQPVNPDTLLMNAFESFQLLAQDKGISLNIELPDEDISVYSCDGDKIYQALSILLQNAISYTEKGGTICLSLHEDTRHLYFSVADTGCGIPPSERTQIFERFYRAENSHHDKNHFGLGLCIANEIAAAHKGQIQVTDNQPKGTIFTLALPK